MGSSYHMEKEGLERGLHFFETNYLSIGLLVTDRHRQIDAWLRNTQPEIKHRYDVWHVAKCKAIHSISVYTWQFTFDPNTMQHFRKRSLNWHRRKVVKLLESGCGA